MMVVVTTGIPIRPSPFKSWWKIVSFFSGVALVRDRAVAGVMACGLLLLLSVLQTMYWSALETFHATSYPLLVCSVPIGAILPNCPAATEIGRASCRERVQILMLSRK